MYLKKIEVQGFKSFANRLVFEFDNGITGIVGPNGSGKSNIADAVRWVLGEQSARQLRGAKMEDIIFAGTQTRKPVSFASVSLTIDNSDHKLDIDYDEVTVTRRVFRSGESEYMINGNNCRLKDINELFYDTGIGKEGYSIIGQGQVDKILSGKPEERREIFDEAAGIVKFKKRKAAAQKSLENETNNLVRISDILSELEKQVGPLEKQAEKAREYLKLKEKLKTYDINLFLKQAETFTVKINELNEKLDVTGSDIERTTEELDRIKTAYDEKDSEIQNASSRIDELARLLSSTEIEKNRLSGRIEILREQIKSVSTSDEHFSERIGALNDQIEERNEEKSRLLKEKFRINDSIDEVFARQNEASGRVTELENEISLLSSDMEKGRNAIMENLSQKGTIMTSIQKYETMLEQIGIRKAEINSRLINFKTDEDQFDNALSDCKNKLDAITAETNNLISENEKLSSEREELKNERAAAESKLNSAREQSMRIQSRLETLRNIAERYDGYGNSIRKVMECRDKNPGIIGVVADIIKTESRYEVAIETALGGTIQNIVTDTEDTAKKMIQYLKQNKFGRATFLPLSAVSGRKNSREELKSETGFIGYASDLVDTEPRYKELTAYLLGRCVVTDTIDNALIISRKYNHSLKIVTLEGELLNPGGSMTGGAFKNSSNLLGRRREIEELKELLAKAEKSVEKFSEEIKLMSEKMSEISIKITSNKDAIQARLIDQNNARHEYSQAEAKQNEIKSMYADNRKEIAEIESRVKEINGNLTSLYGELQQIEDFNEHTEREGEELSARLSSLRAELNDRKKIAEDIRVEYSEISQKADFTEESIKRVLCEIERLQGEEEELKDNKVDSVREIETRNKEIEEINRKISDTGQKISSYNEELTKLREMKEKLNISIKSFFESREECQNRLVELEKEEFRLSQSKEKYETARDNSIDYMWNEYEITLNQASELRDENLTNETEMKKMVSSLKNDIRKLGDVNVNAIEDYKEVSERYDFLKGQHDDLIEAREKLISVIDELDTGMRTQFEQKFGEIKIEFDKVFKQLFGGGKGTIELDPDADILESDITIISQPPGKKLQNMMQLSGGEKALTAICLLFAIQNLKPSPFCLLDEIEAALDDSNVDRFAKYLHNLTKNTQFIVITHRRGTMAAADRLYGITMQEKGVSTLVSVDLASSQIDNQKEQRI